MRRSILHVAGESTLAGGLGFFIAALSDYQAAAGDTVAVAAPRFDGFAADVADRGVDSRVWSASPRPEPAVVREVVSLGRIVRDLRPDVVHLHSSKAGLDGRLLLRGRVATIFQPNGWSFLARTGRVQRLVLRWEKFATRWTDAIVCVSDDERRRALDDGLQADFRVLPNGIDLKSPELRPGDRAEARTQLGLGPEPLAVCVGRLHRQKNQGALLDIWPSVRQAVPDAALVLVGEGPDREALAARSVPGVRLVGHRDDVARWLTAATVVVQPSIWEGLSYAVLEAMACARSVVVSDAPGMADAVVEGCGAVVPKGDLDALRRALIPRLQHPARSDEEGRAGRRTIERSHDLRRQLRDVSRLYDEVLARRDGGRSSN